MILHLEQGLIDKQKLLEIQQDANLLTAFADQFIIWVVDHYQDLCQFIRTQYDSILNLMAGGIFYQERLNRSGAVISIAYGVLLKFWKGWDVGLNAQTFNTIIANVLEHQIEYLNLQGKDEPDYTVEVFKYLRMKSNCGLVVDGCPKRGFLRGPIYHNADSQRVFMRHDAVDEISQSISGQLKKTLTVHALLNALDAQGIIDKDKNKAGTRTKKMGGARCTILKYNKLEDYVLEVAEESEDEYGNWF